MQRIEDKALIVSCDFCAIDWDGSSPVIEGHRGSIICLECLKIALDGLEPAASDYQCVLCLRESIPSTLPRWSHRNRPSTCACRNCVHQAAEVFDADPDIPWTWQRNH